jgi:ABC-type uncharacterized transport system permease subunit
VKADGYPAEAILMTVITASTPLVIASIGELVTERSGVLNLGVEGMMVMGAVCAFIVPPYACRCDRLALYRHRLPALLPGALFSLLFGFLTLTLVANQVATGLALTILGLGLSGMIGEPYVGVPASLPQIVIPGLSEIPFIGLSCSSRTDLLSVDRAGRRRELVPVQEPRRPEAALRRRQPCLGACTRHQCHPDRYLAVMFGGACAGSAGAICRWSTRRNGWKT